MKILKICYLFFSISLYAQDIDFQYYFETDCDDSELIHVEAILKNNSNKDIYFLSWSCNDLDYLLSTNSQSVTIEPWILCNMTWPVNTELKAKSSYRFVTKLRLKQPTKKINLTLQFIKLLKNTKVKDKSHEEIINDLAIELLLINGRFLD